MLLLEDSKSQHDGATTQTMIGAAPNADEPQVHDADAGRSQVSSTAGSAPVAELNAELPEVLLTLTAVDCGSCFDLSVSADGGRPPYRFEWEDGSNTESRHVCIVSGVVVVAVVVEDSNHQRSSVRVMRLDTDADSAEACSSNTKGSQLCLSNLSFEGTAALNTGSVFDAAPWTDCVHPLRDPLSNTPEIASDTLDPASGIAPAPTDGLTYLALATDEQASQMLCEVLPAQVKVSMQLDVMQLGLGGPDVFLQIWGGTSAMCAQEQLLWMSPRLSSSWMTYCAPLTTQAPMDQITLRAAMPTGVTPLPTSYLAVDHLVPVTECP